MGYLEVGSDRGSSKGIIRPRVSQAGVQKLQEVELQVRRLAEQSQCLGIHGGWVGGWLETAGMRSFEYRMADESAIILHYPVSLGRECSRGSAGQAREKGQSVC